MRKSPITVALVGALTGREHSRPRNPKVSDRLRRPDLPFPTRRFGDTVDLEWRDGRLVVGGVEYQRIAFHQEDAERVAQLLEHQ